MKYFLTLILLVLLVPIQAQERTCYTPEQIAPQIAYLSADPLDGCYPFTVYIEVDYPLHLEAQRRGFTIESHIEGYLEEVRKLFEADGLQASFIVHYWKTPSPYSGTSTGEVLGQFREKISADGGYPGNLAHLLSNLSSGGINFVDILCNQSFGVGYSSINLSYRPYPEYSWDLLVLPHEIGHGLGSPHSHSCSWPGGAIDGCSPFGVEGNCPDPGLPARGQASIMSYCHLRSDVGIDLAYGFGPLPLALIKNKIAGANCVECQDGPDDPVVVDTCAGNEIIIEVLVDLWAQETSWEVLNGDGAVVASSEPYPKFPINYIYSDTLCLPDGCYSFVIKDVDGLAGVVPGYEGMYVVNGPNGELASGQNFTNSETTRFCFGTTPPSGDCTDLPLRVANLVNYANQSMFRWATMTNVGDNGVEISGNNWQAVPIDYDVTPNTVLTCEVWVETVGEVNGIGLVDNNSGIYPGRSFRFAGTQRWGVPIEQVPVGGWHPVSIPVGQYMSGAVSYLVLINDNDGSNGAVQTAWRNVELCEDGGANLIDKARTQVQGSVLDELGDGGQIGTFRSPYPNPVNDTLHIGYETMWHLYGSTGCLVTEGWGDKVNMTLLPAGVYILHDGRNAHKVVKQ